MIGASRLGVQAHCLRFDIQQGLEPLLARIAGLGFAAIELVCFPGCRGNRWGDFGAATDRPAAEIGTAIRAAGLTCPSVMVSPQEALGVNLAQTIEWVRDTGATRLVLTSLPTPGDGSLQEWTNAFANLNQLGARIGESGLDFGIHTQPGLWATTDGILLADRLLEMIDPAVCQIEFDPSGAIIYGADAAAYLRQRPEAFFALHLRDGRRPPNPVFYLASEPLGQRYIDWPSLLEAAARSSIQWYFLEMETTDAADTLPAITSSLQFLKSQGLIRPLASQAHGNATPRKLS
jgi:sugar phosphate isomerase/epimerase